MTSESETLLRLVSEAVDNRTRDAAAVNFNEHLRSRWLPAGVTPIEDSEKQQIKTRIVSLMCSSSILSKLSGVIAVIGKHDFPSSWPELLPELISCLHNAALAGDYPTVNGILGIADSLFRTFRHRTDFLYLDYKEACEAFAPPLLEIFLKTASLLDSNASSEMLKTLIMTKKLCCELFFSLNCHHVSELFKDHRSEWMGEFRKCLSSHYPSLESTSAGEAQVDDLRAAVCKNISQYMRNYKEVFKGFLTDFASDVVTLLRHVSKSAERDRDQVATAAFLFLTAVSRSADIRFSGDMIKEIVHSIVIPNITLRHEGEIGFKLGSYNYTRRELVMDFFSALSRNYTISAILLPEINKLWSCDDVWRSKADAVDLMSCARGIALEYAQGFLLEGVLPILNNGVIHNSQILQSVCLKHVTSSLPDISKTIVIANLLPTLIGLIRSEWHNVRSHAAHCIAKLLLVEDEAGKSRYVAGDIKPFMLELMTNLFDALKFPESKENAYPMSCIIRVLSVAEISGEIARPCIKNLTHFLSEVCKNPENTMFNACILVSLAVLIQRACELDISLLPELETALFPSLQKMIMANDITELVPCAFRLLIQLVKLNRPPVGPDYLQIFLQLLSPESWKISDIFPALVGFLQAFLQKAPHEVTQENRLSQVLGIFEKLVSSSSTNELGFHVLNTVIECVDYNAIAPYITNVWRVLFTRPHNETTVEFQQSLVISMSLFLVKHGPDYLVGTVNSYQPDVFPVILEQVWIPNLKLITGTVEVKWSVVAATRLLCVSAALPDPAAAILWGKMLDSTVTLVSRPEEEEKEIAVDETEVLAISENVGWAAAFANLQKEEDFLNDLKDTKKFLVGSLAKLSSAAPGTYPQIIEANLEEANQVALLQLCNAYNCKIV